MDSDTTRLLQAAEAARERGDWHAVHQSLRDAYESGTRLPAAALAQLGLAAWWLGKVSESLAIGEECHRRFLAEGDEEAAAANAVDVAVTWILRGDVTIGSGWLGRARRLQEGIRPGSPTVCSDTSSAWGCWARRTWSGRPRADGSCSSSVRNSVRAR